LLDPIQEQPTPEEETINLASHADFFKKCDENRDLWRSIHCVVPVRPMDGMNCLLTRMLTIWYGEGCAWSQLNDHMGGFIELTRANMVYSFLKKQKAWKYLLMLDNDMEPPIDLPYLLARHDQPVVGAPAMSVDKRFGPQLCFTIKDTEGKYRFPAMRNGAIPGSGLREVGHIGTGALLIRRDVIESFSFTPGDTPFYVPEDVRQKGARTGNLLIGEDIAFCNAVRAKGFKMYVDLEAHVGHRKTVALMWDDDLRDPAMDSDSWVLPAHNAKVIGSL